MTQDRAPLAGVVVLDLTRFVSGPYCTMLMADAGATVVKVEPPDGDASRRAQPVFPVGDGHVVGATFMRMNRGKRSVVLDLKSPAGRDALTRLITKADVLVENFRYGVLADLGFDTATLDRLNSRLVYCTITGFGHSASGRRARPAFNLIAEYEAGVFSRPDPGNAPRSLGPYVGDLFPGSHALSGILMALYRRSVTGFGGRVDIAMFDAMLSLNEAAISNATWLDDAEPDDSPDYYCPSGVFPSGDGFVCIDVVTDRQWETLCQVIGRPDLSAMPQLATGPRRSVNYNTLLAAPLLTWLAVRRSEDVATLLSSSGVPSAVVRQPGEVLASRQAQEREMVIEVGESRKARMQVPASPIRIDDMTSPHFAVVPRLGQHTDEVLRELAGLTPDQISAVRESMHPADSRRPD
ncbi:CaiB/BaiF CoA transferase family protein [Leekyejoonella antrihumi]|nr:CoA transferase [Leekyejoonella antrihumi]